MFVEIKAELIIPKPAPEVQGGFSGYFELPCVDENFLWPGGVGPKRRLAVEEQDPAVGDLLRRERVGLGLVLRGGREHGGKEHQSGEECGAHRTGLRRKEIA